MSRGKDKDSDKDKAGIEAVKRAGRSKPVLDALAKRREEAAKKEKEKEKEKEE